MRYVILFIMISGMFSAELPREAQREIASLETAVAKAEATRQAAVNAAVDKAVKSLNDVSMKAKSVEDRRAIDDKILEIKKLKVAVEDGDLLSDGKPKNPIIGKWEMKKSDSTGFVTFSEDGTVQFSQGAGALNTGKWTKTETSYRIDWPQGWVDEFLLPIKDSGTEVKSAKGNGKAVKAKESKP